MSAVSEGFKLSTLNGVKVYNLTAGKALPSFLSDRQKRNLNKREEYQHRVQLIQDFEFPTASTSIKMSRDGQFVVAAGCYKPMIRIFELSEMGMKTERFVDSDIVKLDILSDDYKKMILLQSDRTLEVHAAYGRHFRTRIPKFGRDLLYQRHSCEVFVPASGSDVYRLNLEIGQFMAPLESTSSKSFNCIDQSPLLHLLACGGDDGVVELFDTRAKKSVYTLDTTLLNRGIGEGNASEEVTALRFDVDGMTLSTGDNVGRVNMYDLRRKEPMVTRQHPYEMPIKAIRYHHSKEGRKLVTADAKTMRIWKVGDHREDGSEGGSGRRGSGTTTGRRRHHGDVSSTMFTTIEMPAGLEDVCMCPRLKGDRVNDSGLIMCAGEQSKIMTFYVPELGPAPQWCRYLENITEELEQDVGGSSTSGGGGSGGGNSMYDDYKFVTKEELKELRLEHLIGTALLKGYMHGYFMDVRLYSRSRAVAIPDEFEKWRKKRIQNKLEEKRSKFITMKRNLPKVNPHMALKLLAEKNGGLYKGNMSTLEEAMKDKQEGEGEGEGEGGSGSGSGSGGSALIDDRFSSLFEDEDFAIDERSETFRLSNPSGITASEKALRKKVGLNELSVGVDVRTTRQTLMDEEKRRKNKKERKKEVEQEEEDALEKYQGFELVEDTETRTGERDEKMLGLDGRGERKEKRKMSRRLGGGFEEGRSDNDSDEGAFDALLGVREYANEDSGSRRKGGERKGGGNKRGRDNENSSSSASSASSSASRKKARPLKFFEMREGANDADLVPSTTGRRETMRRAKTAKQRSRLTLAERMKGENAMMSEAKRNKNAYKKHEFSFTPSEEVNRRKREKDEKERRNARKRDKRGMKELLPKSKESNNWKGKKV